MTVCVPRFALVIQLLVLLAIAAHSASADPTAVTDGQIAACVGDCDGDRAVTVDELVLMVGIALGSAAPTACPARECGADPPEISIQCNVAAVRNALDGCPGRGPAGSIPYRLEAGGLARYAPPRRSTGQAVIAGSFDVTVSADGRDLTLTDVSFRLGYLDPTFITGDGVIEVAEHLSLRADLSIDGQQVELAGEAPLSALWGNPPSILDVTLCGAPAGAVSCATLSAGEAAGYALTFSAAPQATQTPGPTPTATPVVLTRYRLLEGSSIARLDDGGGGPATARHPLSGTFTVAPCAFVPNTFFALVITGADLDGGPDYAIDDVAPSPIGCPGGAGVGYLEALTLNFPPEVYALLLLNINGRRVGFSGSGPFDAQQQWTFGRPPRLENIRFCGSPAAGITCQSEVEGLETVYELLISAVPEE